MAGYNGYDDDNSSHDDSEKKGSLLGRVTKKAASIAVAASPLGALNHVTDGKVTKAVIKTGETVAKLATKQGQASLKADVASVTNKVKASLGLQKDKYFEISLRVWYKRDEHSSEKPTTGELAFNPSNKKIYFKNLGDEIKDWHIKVGQAITIEPTASVIAADLPLVNIANAAASTAAYIFKPDNTYFLYDIDKAIEKKRFAITTTSPNAKNKIALLYSPVGATITAFPNTFKFKITLVRNELSNQIVYADIKKIVPGKDVITARTNLLSYIKAHPQKLTNEDTITDPDNILGVNTDGDVLSGQYKPVLLSAKPFTSMHFEIPYTSPNGSKGKVKVFGKETTRDIPDPENTTQTINVKLSAKEDALYTFKHNSLWSNYIPDEQNIKMVEELITMSDINNEQLISEVEDFDSLPLELKAMILAKAKNTLDDAQRRSAYTDYPYEDDSEDDEEEYDDDEEEDEEDEDKSYYSNHIFNPDDLCLASMEIFSQVFDSTAFFLKMLHHGLDKRTPVSERILDRNAYNEFVKLFKDIIVDQYMDYVKDDYLADCLKTKLYVSNMSDILAKLSKASDIINHFTFGSKVALVYDYLQSVHELMAPVMEKIDSEDKEDNCDDGECKTLNLRSYINSPLDYVDPDITHLYSLSNYVR